jgi:hypothetical protein
VGLRRVGVGSMTASAQRTSAASISCSGLAFCGASGPRTCPWKNSFEMTVVVAIGKS